MALLLVTDDGHGLRECTGCIPLQVTWECEVNAIVLSQACTMASWAVFTHGAFAVVLMGLNLVIYLGC